VLAVVDGRWLERREYRWQNRGTATPPPDNDARTPLLGRWKALSRIQKALATAATAAGLAIVGWFVNWGMPRLVDLINPPLEAPVASRLFIVDTSASMEGRLGRQKFDAAVSEISRYARNTPEVALALRTAGGVCTEGYREPPVTFESDNVDDIRAELAAARPGGPANIVSQIEQGTNDFQRFDVAKSAQVQSIWLFLGTARDCRNEDVPLGEAIRRALLDSPAKVSYVDFFVLRGDSKSYANLRKSIEALGKGTSFVIKRVGTQQQLRRTLEEAEQREKPSD
jgi:hypothetical protein